MRAAKLAGWDRRLRPLITRLPPRTVVSRYSRGRLGFLSLLNDEDPPKPYIPSEHLGRVLWGINFRSPIMNAAGMFKNGECYAMVNNQGAAAFLGGTGTFNPRFGNEEDGIYLPFVPYPRSGAASNWLGLPNDGDIVNAARVSEIERVSDCPVGWSVMGSPDFEGEEKLNKLVQGMEFYEAAGVDFLEINESCPNTAHGKPQDDDLFDRLLYVKQNFLDSRVIFNRDRPIPVVIKFSNDTEVAQVKPLLDMLFDLGYDGVNFGNTSTDYKRHREAIVLGERRLYDFFTTDEAFGVGGGVSGRLLKQDSLELAATAVQHVRAGPPSQEFHVIRTGGIESWDDIRQSENEGISMNQWFTGYWEAFAKHGHDVYKSLYAEVT